MKVPVLERYPSYGMSVLKEVPLQLFHFLTSSYSTNYWQQSQLDWIVPSSNDKYEPKRITDNFTRVALVDQVRIDTLRFHPLLQVLNGYGGEQMY